MKRWIAFLLLIIILQPVQAAAQLPEGEQYSVAVTLSGGTGRVTVNSPTQMIMTNGAAFATVTWSSPYYEFMLVDGVRYDPVSNKGESVFEIPVLLDTDMAVSAQTAAMSQPHMIEYTLRFDSATMKKIGGDRSVQWIVPVAVIVVAAAGLLLLALRKKSKAERA